MATDYPFDLPDAILCSALTDIARAAPPWGDLDPWILDGDLTAFGYFDTWHFHTNLLMTSLLHTIRDLAPADYESEWERERWEILEGTVEALRLRLLQFAGLLAWARGTWKHDPETLKLINPPHEIADTSAGDDSPAVN